MNRIICQVIYRIIFRSGIMVWICILIIAAVGAEKYGRCLLLKSSDRLAALSLCQRRSFCAAGLSDVGTMRGDARVP